MTIMTAGHTGQLIVPVILAGGAGNRLWPLSREEYPKQLLSLLGDYTLIQDTLLRFTDRSRFAEPIVITNESIRFTVAEQIQSIGFEKSSLILEPVGRGTAAAAALGALLAQERDPEAIILIAPSDHVILNSAAFITAVDTAIEAARRNFLVTFSVTPTRAETGYGYIRQGQSLTVPADAYRVAEFVEKPVAAKAEEMVSDGLHFWNSGMFVFKASHFLAELQRYAPEVLAATRASLEQRTTDLDFVRPNTAAFSAGPSISVDYAVMERTDSAATVSLDAGWSDIGAWSELWRISEKDAQGNVSRGDVILEDSSNCLVISGTRLATLIGVSDLTVVVTDDAVMVANHDKAQAVRQVVNRLRETQRGELANHVKVNRPWGYYHSIHSGTGFQVKRLTVKPGARLSL
ncbi:MAG: mannose-1-phosphate guanylyltransferase/mannose-6-phosphate isomerase, partial [Dongiaceae bacterium]